MVRFARGIRSSIEGERKSKMACKRKLEGFENMSDVSYPSPNAKIHSVISALSPMKKSRSCSYFDGEITDGKACMRLFGFD